MADFQVYYGSANDLLQGKAVYGTWHYIDSGIYKYAPVTLFAFVPFALLDLHPASLLYYLLVCFFMIAVAAHIVRLLIPFGFRQSPSGWALFISTVFVGDHLVREWHLGNTNLFLLAVALSALYGITKGHKYMPGILLGVAMLFKPHFAILLPWLLLRGHWRALFTSILTIGFGLLLPAVCVGWDRHILLLHGWIETMLVHNASLTEAPNTIYGLVHALGISGNVPTPVVVVGVLACAGSAFLAIMYVARRSVDPIAGTFLEFTILLATIPLLAPTDTEHFMWVWPAATYCFAVLLTSKVQNRWFYWTLLVLAFIPFSLNSPDLVGRKITHLMDEGGLLGLADLVVLGVFTALLLTREKKSVATGSIVTS